jgi:TRAP-type C4-dicarboxylate transport system permease small subunit
MSKIKAMADKLCNILNWMAGIVLSIMLFITFAQVVMRKVFNRPFIWAEELTLAMLVWFGYITISVVVKEDGHMSITFLYNMLGKKMKLLLDVLKHALMIGFSALMAVYSIQMAKNAYGNVLPASQISRSLLYIPLVISGVLIIVFSIIHLIDLFLKPHKGEGV